MLLRAGGGSSKMRGALYTLNAGFLVPTSGGEIGPAGPYPASRVPLDTKQWDTENCFDPVNFRFIVPSWVNWVKLLAKASFPLQGSVNATGRVGIHLFRNSTSTAEAHYHVRDDITIQIAVTAAFKSMLAATPWIPVQTLNETWDMDIFQNVDPAGMTLFNLGANRTDNFLSINFSR